MEIVNVINAGQGRSFQDYSSKDKVLIQSNFINASFGDTVDKVEVFLYDENGNILTSVYDYTSYTPYELINSKTNKYSKILIDPVKDATSLGFNRGSFNIQYNFNKNLFNSSDVRRYWIKEISPSRTELKLSSQVIADNSILEGYNQYIAYTSLKNYYPEFYLNFGNNESIIAINVATLSDNTGTYLLIKLYEPLPFDYDVKTQLWIFDKIAESVSYNVDIQIQAEVVSTQNSLRGPNYNVRINEKNAQTTPYYTYASLLASPVTSSVRQLSSYYQDKAVSINVDFTNFSNFVHFSSATERVNNFVYKLGLIENYNKQIISQSAIVGNSTVKTAAITTLQTAVSNIIENFDIYEYYLYYSSESFAWPKYNTTKPYQNVSVTSSLAYNWLGSATTVPSQYTASILYSASLYDDTNKDILRGVIPQYIYDDPSNQPYSTFIDMIGQHFDNVWVYYKDVTNRFNATNNPNTGISMDMVSEALRGMGMQLYTNTNVSDNVYYDLFGYNYDGSLLPPTGSEKIDTYVTSSLTTQGSKTLQQEIYKRIYHNLPYLLKTKGTQRSIKALISIYGIPEGILTVNEFGGYDRNAIVGVDSINNTKITTTTSSFNLSSSVLSPYATLQYYDNNKTLNSTNVEVGFSIADVLNRNITSSLGYFSIDQLLGDPGYAYSSSYAPLVSASNAYFSSYTQPHSVWEYIRLIKYFNNSLFKTIKDFVPARANLSTGIIVKSHILERNKYARHEPSASFHEMSQSIDILTLTAEPGNIFSGSNTNWNYSQVTPLGYVPVTSSQNVEKLTGEFGGTEVIVTDGEALSQLENSNNSTLGAISVNLGALFQNISGSVRSTKFFDLDYTSNQLVPINLNLITQSISSSVNYNYDTYTNLNNPYAQLQDYNYATRHFTDPRYYGSRVESSTYNTYTLGDTSYGKTAAIDKKVPYFAYLVDIYTSSFNLNGRSNAQIKYMIDRDQNVLDLTKANTNVFYTQNIFKSGEGTNISLFNYDPRNRDVQFLTNKSTIGIYEGGFRYSPVLFNVTNNSSLIYQLSVPEVITTSTAGSSATGLSNAAGASSYVTLGTATTSINFAQSGADLIAYVTCSFDVTRTGTLLTTYFSNDIYVELRVTSSVPSINVSVSDPSCPIDYVSSGAGTTLTGLPASYPVSSVSIDAEYKAAPEVFIIPANTVGGTFYRYYQIEFRRYNSPCFGNWSYGNGSPTATRAFQDIPTLSGVNPAAIILSSTVATSTTSYVTKVIDPTGSLYVDTDGQTIRFTATQSLYYGKFIQSASYVPKMDEIVFPFTIDPGDMLKLSSSLGGWIEEEEYRIVNTYTNTIGIPGITYLYAKLDRQVNLKSLQNALGFPATASSYIINKHVPDETNIILRYDPENVITQDGLLFPQYIDSKVKDDSGNIVKALRAQNILPPALGNIY